MTTNWGHYGCASGKYQLSGNLLFWGEMISLRYLHGFQEQNCHAVFPDVGRWQRDGIIEISDLWKGFAQCKCKGKLSASLFLLLELRKREIQFLYIFCWKKGGESANMLKTILSGMQRRIFQFWAEMHFFVLKTAAESRKCDFFKKQSWKVWDDFALRNVVNFCQPFLKKLILLQKMCWLFANRPTRKVGKTVLLHGKIASGRNILILRGKQWEVTFISPSADRLLPSPKWGVFVGKFVLEFTLALQEGSW